MGNIFEDIEHLIKDIKEKLPAVEVHTEFVGFAPVIRISYSGKNVMFNTDQLLKKISDGSLINEIKRELGLK